MATTLRTVDSGRANALADYCRLTFGGEVVSEDTMEYDGERSVLAVAGDNEFKVRVERDLGSVAYVTLCGDLNVASAAVLDTALRALPCDVGEVRLDLADLSFVDTGGLNVLIAVNAFFGGKLTLAHPQPGIAEALQATGLDQYFITTS